MSTRQDTFNQPAPDRRETLCVIGYFAVLTLVFSWPVITSGLSFYAFDILNGFLPWAVADNTPANNLLISDPLAHLLTSNQLLHEGLNSGNIPFWNPWLFAGVPFEPAINPIQIALLYLLDPVRAHDANLVIHLFAAGTCFYWWARLRGLMTYAAIFGGTAWMFNGYLMVWFEWEFAIMTAAMLPLVLVTFDLCQRSPGFASTGFLALAMALLVSTGFYQLTAYCVLFFTAYILFDHFSRQNLRFTELAKTFAPVAVASVLAISLTLPYFIPKIDVMLGSGDIQRLPFSYEQLITIVSKLEPAHLLLALFPNLFSNPAGPTVMPFPGGMTHMYNNYNELCLYAGIPVVVILSCTWIFNRDRDVRFFAILAAVVLLMTAGTYLYYPVFLLPGLEFTTPNRLLFIFGFCTCALASLLFHKLFSETGHTKNVVISIGVLLFGVSILSVALLSGALIPAIYPVLGDDEVAAAHVALLTHAEVITTPFVGVLITAGLLALGVYRSDLRKVTSPLLILILAADLIYFGFNYNTKAIPDTQNHAIPQPPMIGFLQNQPGIFRTATYQAYFLHNYLQPYHLEDIGGYLSVFPKSYAEFIHLSQNPESAMPAGYQRWLAIEHLGHPLLSMAGMKYFVGPPGAELGHPDFTRVYSDEVSIFENNKAFDRVYFVCNASYLQNTGELFNALLNADTKSLETGVLITGSGKDVISEDCESAVSVTPLANGELSISLANRQEGLLVIANQYDQHWKLQSSSESWPLLRANHTFMAAIQPPGFRQLRLSYEPRWHQRTYLWSIVLWVLILTILAGRSLYRLTR